MENFTYNHYIDFSLKGDNDFLEKEKLVLRPNGKIIREALEEKAKERLYRKRLSKKRGDITDGQYLGYKFEKEIWNWLLKLKPQIVNHPGYDLNLDLKGYKIDSSVSKPYQDTKQTDVFATFNDHVFIVECKATAENKNFSVLKKEMQLLRALMQHKNKRVEKLFGERAIPVHIVALKGYEISEEQKSEELSNADGSIIVLTEKERKYINIVLESSTSEEFALNQFLGFFRTGKPDFNKWVMNEKTGIYQKKKFKIAAFSSNSGTGRKQNVYTFSIEPRDMLKISTVSHQKAKNIFEFGRSSGKYYQRLLTGKRLSEIGTHLTKHKTPFPNNILVSHRGKRKLTFEPDPINEDTNSGRRPGKLVFDGCPGTFHVIDGQHRLFGYMAVSAKEDGLRDKHRLIVTVFDELEVGEEADIFLEVNEKSQKVKSDLIMEIEYAAETPSKSNLCNGVIFNLRDNPHSALYDKIAPAEEKRRKGLQPWDIKPTDLKNVLMKCAMIGGENYERGIFWDTDYNITAEKIARHINAMLEVIRDRSGYWHNNIPSRYKSAEWYSPDMAKNSKGFLQNILTKGLFKLFDRITIWCNKNLSLSNEELTEKCKEILQEITQNFNNRNTREKYTFFEMRTKYGQGESAIDLVSSLFLTEFLDEEKYPGLINDIDKARVDTTEKASSKEYEEAMIKIEDLEEKIKDMTGPGEKAQLLEGEFRSKIHFVFEKLFGSKYFTDIHGVFFKERALRPKVDKAMDRLSEAEEVLRGDPDPEMGLHNSEIEYLEWVDWIEIIAELVKRKDVYKKQYMNHAIKEDLEDIIRRVFYVDNIKDIKSCNYKEGTNWMTVYNELRRPGVHRGTAKLTPTQTKKLEELEPKVQEKIRLMTDFYLS
ncbi:DGQHR domain-containing protein [bacterium]|nr:DGQHR domain-containing protein [bacterium]